jgi:hypothetical protein
LKLFNRLDKIITHIIKSGHVIIFSSESFPGRGDFPFKHIDEEATFFLSILIANDRVFYLDEEAAAHAVFVVEPISSTLRLVPPIHAHGRNLNMPLASKKRLSTGRLCFCTQARGNATHKAGSCIFTRD